jgi:hypothetical protein
MAGLWAGNGGWGGCLLRKNWRIKLDQLRAYWQVGTAARARMGGNALVPGPPSQSKKSVTELAFNRCYCTAEVVFKATSGVVLGISAHAF